MTSRGSRGRESACSFTFRGFTVGEDIILPKTTARKLPPLKTAYENEFAETKFVADENAGGCYPPLRRGWLPTREALEKDGRGRLSLQYYKDKARFTL